MHTCVIKEKFIIMNNREYFIRKNINSRNENREKFKLYRREYMKRKREIDPFFKIAHNLSRRTHNAFKNQNMNKSNKTMELIGCTKEFLKNWIQFQLYGDMTVENYGKIWQLDHTLPISSFNLSDENEMRKCFFGVI